MLQRENTDVAQVKRQLLIELLQQALDDGEALRVAGDDQGAGALVHRDDRLVLVADIARLLRRVEVGQNLLHHRRLGVGEREDAHRFQPGGGRNVELVNNVTDKRHHVAARGDDQDVGEVVGLDDEGGPDLGAFGGAGGAGFLERAHPGDLRVQTLGARHDRPFGKDGLQQRHEAQGRGVLETEQFYLRHKPLDRLVEVFNQFRGQLDGFVLTAEDERV